MYRRIRLLIFALMLPLLSGFPASWAAEYGLLPADDSALGQRTPLVLVHGINPAPKKLYNWQGFLDLVKRDTEFQSRYKTYFFVFNPTKPVRENGQELQKSLLEFREKNPEAQHFRFAALSLGGLLVREAIYRTDLWDQTDRVIAISVPFHGTPLATKAWMQAGFRNVFLFNPVRRFDTVAYQVTKRKFPHFAEDYCWDNFDGNLPVSIARQQACINPTSIHPPFEEQQKYIVYAGFFGADSRQRSWLRQYLGVAGENSFNATRTALLGRHMMFSVVQPCLAALPLIQSPPDGIAPMTAFNDGISPISSQLWLGRYVRRGRDGKPVGQEQLWQAVQNLRGSMKARLFDGVDHRDWLEGQTRYEESEGKLQDWLHPDEPQKNIFEWLKADLLRD